MDNFTIQVVKTINKDFYDKVGDDFDKTRKKEWEGWQEVAEQIRKYRQPSILDVGCGNGRFLDFLIKSRVDFKLYHGVDSNDKLLKIAKLKYEASNIKFDKQDIFGGLILKDKFDVVVMFGLMHHIPFIELRYKIINQLLMLVKRGGFLVVSIWSFMDSPKYRSKVKSNSEVIGYLNNNLGIKIAKLELEENDYFLGWGSPNKAYRYCHYFDKEELAHVMDAFQEYKPILLEIKAGNDQLNKYLYFHPRFD